MPMGGAPLAAGELEIVKRWIDNGAKADPPGEARKATVPAAPIQPRVAVKPAVYAMAWSGGTIAAGGFHQVRVYDADGKQQFTLDGHVEAVRAIAINGELLATGGGLPAQKGEVKVWNLQTRQLVATVQGHTDCVYAVALSPDGSKLATASYDKMIYLWDPRTGAQIRPLKDHIDAVYALAFTPDGTKLISAGADRTVKVWNPATGQRLYTLSESTDSLQSLAVSPDGKQVVAGGNDKTIRIWTIGDTAGALRTSLIAHEDAILRVAWSGDGKRIATASADRSIKIFRADDLTELQTIPGQPEWVTGLAFSPDGRRLAAFRQDGSMQFYDLR
jgi:WD40 repeat protein